MTSDLSSKFIANHAYTEINLELLLEHSLKAGGM